MNSRMKPSVVVRSDGRRTLIDMPYEGRGAGFRTIRAAIGTGGSIHYGDDWIGWFSVAKKRTAALIAGLVDRYGEIEVELPRKVKRCTRQCWDAKGPDCECACAATNHSSGEGRGVIVSTFLRSTGEEVELSFWRAAKPTRWLVTPGANGGLVWVLQEELDDRWSA